MEKAGQQVGRSLRDLRGGLGESSLPKASCLPKTSALLRVFLEQKGPREVAFLETLFSAAYFIVSMQRARLIAFVTCRCWAAFRPVNLRGRILPVSVT